MKLSTVYISDMEGVNGLQFSIVCVGRIWRESNLDPPAVRYTISVVLTNLLRNETETVAYNF
jgi:hypothetical protein